jgi:tetratricopeptide (TPR) repeat protein
MGGSNFKYLFWRLKNKVMKLNEIFQNTDCKIYKVINFYDAENIENWLLEQTKYQLIPDPNDTDDYDAYFIVRGFIVSTNKIEDCFIDVCIPERISEFAFRLIDNELVIDNIYDNDKNLKTIPAMASECFGDYGLYYAEENPQLGIDILKNGLAVATHKNVVAEDLGYILRDEGQFEEAIESFKISEENGPSSEYTYWELAYLYDELGKTDEAIRYKQKFKEAGGVE